MKANDGRKSGRDFDFCLRIGLYQLRIAAAVDDGHKPILDIIPFIVRKFEKHLIEKQATFERNAAVEFVVVGRRQGDAAFVVQLGRYARGRKSSIYGIFVVSQIACHDGERRAQIRFIVERNGMRQPSGKHIGRKIILLTVVVFAPSRRIGLCVACFGT